MSSKRHTLVMQLTGRLGIFVLILLAVFAVFDFRVQSDRIFQSTMGHIHENGNLLKMFLTQGRAPEKWESSISDYCHQMSLCGAKNHQLSLVSPAVKLLSTTGSRNQLFPEEEALVRQAVETGKKAVMPASDGRKLRMAGVAFPLETDKGALKSSILLYTEPLAEYEKLVSSLLVSRILLLTVLLGLIVAIVFLVVKEKVGRPLEALYLHQYDVSKGILERREYPDPNNEISEIYDMFNAMVDRLKKHEEAVVEKKTKTARYEAIEAINIRSRDKIRQLRNDLDRFLNSLAEDITSAKTALKKVRGDIDSISNEMESAWRESQDEIAE